MTTDQAIYALIGVMGILVAAGAFMSIWLAIDIFRGKG